MLEIGTFAISCLQDGLVLSFLLLATLYLMFLVVKWHQLGPAGMMQLVKQVGDAIHHAVVDPNWLESKNLFLRFIGRVAMVLAYVVFEFVFIAINDTDKVCTIAVGILFAAPFVLRTYSEIVSSTGGAILLL